jgi:hypothetical protein
LGRALSVDPDNSNDLYAGEVQLWKYHNDKWTRITGCPPTGTHVDFFELKWVGSDLVVTNDGGIFRSSDKGTTYQSRNTDLPIAQFYWGALHPTNSNFALVGVQDNGTPIYSDNRIWQQLGLGDGMSTAISAVQPDTHWLVSSSGMRISRTRSDGSVDNVDTTIRLNEKFDNVTPPTLPAGWTATNAVNPDKILWVTSNSGNPSPPVDSPPNAAFINDPAVVSDKRLDSRSIAVGTSSWAQLSFRNNYNLETSFDGGVLEISVAGGAFQDIVAAGGSFVAGGYNGAIRTGFGNPIEGRAAWTGSSSGFITTTVNLPAAAAGQNIVLRWRMGSSNSGSGQGWRVDTILVEDGIDTTCRPFFARFVSCPSQDVVIAGTSKLWRSDGVLNDDQYRWDATNSPDLGCDPEYGISNPVRSIAFARSDTSCSTYAFGGYGGVIWATTNAGVRWSQLGPGSQLPPRTVTDLAFDPQNSKTLYATFSGYNQDTQLPGHLFVCKDITAGSPTWVDISPPINTPHDAIAIDPNHTSGLYVGTDIGVVISTDSGKSWSSIPSNQIPNVQVWNIEINRAANKVVVFTYGRGAYSGSLPIPDSPRPRPTPLPRPTP